MSINFNILNLFLVSKNTVAVSKPEIFLSFIMHCCLTEPKKGKQAIINC